MVVPLILLFPMSTLLAATLQTGADAKPEARATGYVTATIRRSSGLPDDRVRIGRSSEEWPYAL